ncbi:MAG TPA: amino acid permease [Terriglobales bacterium]|nr:amino acid permease [Terriglobales bacterium]
MTKETTTANRDSAQLEALGYDSKFDRSMSKWANFSLGFTYLSPVVGVYTLFAVALVAGGPAMFWTYLFVGIGQLFVAMVFGEIVSQFPIAGGLYPWARRLVGKRWAWMAGWIYLWALCSTIAGVAVGGAPYVAQLLGLSVGQAGEVAIAIIMIVGTTALNVSGTKLLARVAMFGFICELVGAIIVGGYLLIVARHQSFRVLFQTFGLGNGHYFPAFVASSVAAMWCYYGFEACGDVAEETPDASRAIPKAMRMTIYVGGFAAMLVCLAFVLAVPDLNAVFSGKDTDPVVTILNTAMGPVGLRAVIAVVMVSFFSCLISLEAATSRLLFSYGRDRMIFGSKQLSTLSERTRVPVKALLFAGIVPAFIAIAGLFLKRMVEAIVVSSATGIYVAFQMIVLAALIARAKGWKPRGAFRLGIWAWPVNLAALTYGVLAIINMVWPRTPQDPWYSNYGTIVVWAAVFAIGLFYAALFRPYDHGDAAAGDAHLN